MKFLQERKSILLKERKGKHFDDFFIKQSTLQHEDYTPPDFFQPDST